MVGDFDFDFASNERASGAPPAPMGQETAAVTQTNVRVQPDAASARGAGVALIFAALGGGVGAVVGGAWGFGAGILFVGAARNALRARQLWGAQGEPEREEAAKSATMGIVGAAAGGYLAYRAYRKDQSDG